MLTIPLLLSCSVFCDVVTFVLQISGSIMSGDKDPNQASQGRIIALIGLVVQLVSFALYSLLLIIFALRV